MGRVTCSRKYSVMAAETESRVNVVMVKPHLTSPITQKAGTRVNLWCVSLKNRYLFPTIVYKRTNHLGPFVFFSQSLRLHIGMSIAWWMLSGGGKVFLPQRKHHFITWHILMPIIQFIDSSTFKIMLNVLHTNR